MNIKTFVFNPFQENTYLVWDDATREALAIDPGMGSEAEWERFRSFVDANGLDLRRVLLTHCHIDHLMGTGYVSEACHAEICGPVGDEAGLPSAVMQSRLFGVPLGKKPAPVAVDIREGMQLTLGGSRIRVFDIAGHSHHGLCYYFEDDGVVFTGDVLFAGSVGRSDFGSAMGGNHETLIEGIVTKLLTLPADVKVCPGHGLATTIGHETEHNPYF
ncbi:MAG: MBL fold metallo-hydrolase [Bacteroidales bacterium]|nr:MBL fold metallo-hydrolase [Candidatus Liminaster caballi]